ncbi:MAG TPA: DUF1049 domain-containing protein [Aquifex aeolicus]|uniref:DUF1049 domain-containing protein n=1 Tax=Aquifex aeolicus TaxID=63363 RepID=A0A7C5LAF3_AQUAO|nr:DUF1049 domain-containing protein [Aquifex aeolicus]
MKSLLYILLFLVIFGISFYFFLMNVDQTVSVNLFGELRTPPLPVGMVVLVAFFAGLVTGVFLIPLIYVIKRLS